MMLKSFLLASVLLVPAQPIRADETGCQSRKCELSVSFSSTSVGRSYGLLIAAPESGCRLVRFRVEGAGSAFLGKTPPLEPGEVAVVRLGRGFPLGENRVKVAAVGCKAQPLALRRVVLANDGPDHSWRAGLH